MKLSRTFLSILVLSGSSWLAHDATAKEPIPRCDVTTGLDGDPGIPQYLIVGMSELVTKEDLTPEEFADHEAHEYGEHGLWFGLPEDGVLRPGDTEVTSEGDIEWKKFGFYRDDIARGDIEMTASLRNNPTATFEAFLPDGYGSVGFQVGGGWFTEGGCWDFFITSGTATMEFTIWVLSGPITGCDTTTNLDGEDGAPQYEIPTSVVAEAGGTPISTEVHRNDGWFYGQEGLWVSLPDAGILVPPVNAESDGHGSVYWQEVVLYRDDRATGEVEIAGTLRRNDTASLVFYVPEGYGNVGYQPALIDFPAVGCWDVTVTSGSATMEFTIWVESGAGPEATPVVWRSGS